MANFPENAYLGTIAINFKMFGNVQLLRSAFAYASNLGSKYLVIVATDLNDYEFESFLIEKDINHGSYSLVHNMKEIQDAPKIIAEFTC